MTKKLSLRIACVNPNLLLTPKLGPNASFFSGARIRLRMTFDYPVLWVRVKVLLSPHS